MKTRTGIQPDNYPNLAVGKATADADGNVIDTTYAKLSQVVTKDSSTNSISALSQDAKYLLRNKQILTSAVTISETGWYRIAQLPSCSSSRITVMKGYSPGRGVSLILDIAVGADDTDKTTSIVASYAGMRGQSDYIDKIRYSPAVSSSVYIDVHIVSSGSQSIYWMAYDGASTNTAFVSGGFALYSFQKTSATGGTELLMPEDTGLATTGTIYQQGSPVLVGYITSGYSTSGSLTLPSAGWYIIKYSFPSHNQVDYTTGVFYWTRKQLLLPVSYYYVEKTSRCVSISSNGVIKVYDADTGDELSVGKLYYYKLA